MLAVQTKVQIANIKILASIQRRKKEQKTIQIPFISFNSHEKQAPQIPFMCEKSSRTVDVTNVHISF